jgi:hypothetical protein
MKHDAADVQRSGLPGHADVDQRSWRIDQSGQFRGSLVAERGIVPYPKERSPQDSFTWRLAAECGVNASMQPLPPARSQPRRDLVTSQSGLRGLAAGHDAVLALDQIGKLRKVTGHAPSVARSRQPRKTRLVSCG